MHSVLVYSQHFLVHKIKKSLENCLQNCFMLSSLPGFPAFCCSAIATSCDILMFFLVFIIQNNVSLWTSYTNTMLCQHFSTVYNLSLHIFSHSRCLGCDCYVLNCFMPCSLLFFLFCCLYILLHF